MYCPRCGTENEESSAFCKSCGAPFAKPVPSLQRKTSFALWVGVAALIIALGVGLYFLWPLLFHGQGEVGQNLNLARSAPSNSSFFLSLRSSQEETFADAWAKIKDNPMMAEGLAEFPANGFDQSLFPYLKPNLQMSGFIQDGNLSFMAMVEVLDQAKAQAGLQELAEQARETGRPFSTKQIGDVQIHGREKPDSLYYAMPANILYLSSSEDGIMTMVRGARGSALIDNPGFKSAVEQLPGETPLFFYLNLAELPDFPRELESLALSAYEKEDRYFFRLVLNADFAGLLNQIKTPQLQAIRSVVQEILTLPARTDPPFLTVPEGTGFAFNSSGWVGSLLEAFLKSQVMTATEMPALSLSWLNGEIELFLASSGGTSSVPPLGFSLELNSQQRSEAEEVLAEIERNFFQPGGEFGPITEEIEGFILRMIETPQGTIFYTLGESHLFLAFDRSTILSLLHIEKDEEKALGQNAELRALAQELGGYHLFVYADAKSLQGLMSLLPQSSLPLPNPSTSELSKLLMAVEFNEKGIRIEGISY